jgi:hypothetical protein
MGRHLVMTTAILVSMVHMKVTLVMDLRKAMKLIVIMMHVLC